MAPPRAVLFLFLLGMLLFASPSRANSSLDYFVFVLMWPGAYCGQSRCCRPTVGTPAENFFIRGLWPYNTERKPLTKCSSTPFDRDELEGVKEELLTYWSNIKCPGSNPSSYWKTAWKTYGTCSYMDEGTYFQAALRLRIEVDVLRLLSHKGIVPSRSHLYAVSSIKSAIAEGIGAEPAIRCSNTIGGMQLYEVHVCVDKYAERVIECPVTPRFTCTPEIYFDPFDGSMLHHSPSDANPIKMLASVE